MNDKYDIPLDVLLAMERKRRRQWAAVLTVAGILGFLLVVLYAGNHGYTTPLYTWLATVWN